jgi:hypothetical protein
MIGADVLGKPFALEGVVDGNLEILLCMENVDTFLVNGIGYEDFHGLVP